MSNSHINKLKSGVMTGRREEHHISPMVFFFFLFFLFSFFFFFSTTTTRTWPSEILPSSTNCSRFPFRHQWWFHKYY